MPRRCIDFLVEKRHDYAKNALVVTYTLRFPPDYPTEEQSMEIRLFLRTLEELRELIEEKSHCEWGAEFNGSDGD